LAEFQFDRNVEPLCKRFYQPENGGPRMGLGVYFLEMGRPDVSLRSSAMENMRSRKQQ
jgi:hypothetical protein